MRTPTLAELRRVLGAALLAAPLAIACRHEPKSSPKERPAPDAATVHASTIDARAARDEARHAAAMPRLLRRRGVAPDAVARPAAPGFASLRALALHNEREGVIGETWGALVARHQAEHAADPDVRAELATIADEETTHAQLAFEIAAWARTVLGDAELDAAELGWPSRDASAAMLDALAPAFA